MSHDLVSLGIASENLLPNSPAHDARPLIQAALQYAQNHPLHVLTLDKGNYYLLTPQNSSATLVLGKLSNITVDLAGSTVYFNGPLFSPGTFNGVLVDQCSNLTLTNFQTDFVNPPYTHVQLTSVDPDNRALHYQTLSNWPDPATFNSLNLASGGGAEGIWAIPFRNGAIVPGTTRMGVTPPIAGSTLTLTQDGTPWTQSAALSTLRAGDIVAVTARSGGSPIIVSYSDSITLSNITVYGSPDWAVNVYATSNSTVDGVRVMPRPVTGLIGSNADGIHFSSVRQNNHIRNSYVTGTVDDALVMDNLHAALVVSETGPRQLSVTRNVYLRFPNGTAVNFVDPATTMEISGSTIVSQDPPDSDSPVLNGQVNLTFDRDLPPVTAGVGMVYAEPAMRGQGSTIEGNVAEDIYCGRGVWISGAQGVSVQKNVLRRTSMAGIVVSQSTDSFDLGDLGPPARDITISDNLLESALGPGANCTGAQTALASIEVASTNDQQFGFASGTSNANISIVNNRIANSGRSAIWVGELNGGTIANNLIGLYDQLPKLPVWGIPSQFLTQVTQDFALPIVIHYSSGVTNQNNSISPTAFNNYEGLWWNSPAGSESGWGINFAHQGDIIFASWFTYDLAGKGWWLTMTAPQTAPNTYSGALYQTTGPAFNAAPFNPAQVNATQVGTGTLSFSDANDGTFTYTVNGVSQVKNITREVFGPLPTCTFGGQTSLVAATNYQDLWWAAPAGSESGWGINFTHEGDTIFATWFTYDLNGTPLWLVVTAPKTAPGVYSGTLYRTTGPPFNAVPFNPANVALTTVGTATFTFSDGNDANFAYVVNGVSQTKQITRQVFQSPGTTCQ